MMCPLRSAKLFHKPGTMRCSTRGLRMNAYTTMSQARIQPCDVAAVLRANGLAGASLSGLERQRGCQAEAEVNRLLNKHGVTPQARTSRFALLRRTIGTALVHAGERLAGVPRGGLAPATIPAVGSLRMSG